MAVVAQESGLGRESLYKSLSADGNPEFADRTQSGARPWTPASEPPLRRKQPANDEGGAWSVCSEAGIKGLKRAWKLDGDWREAIQRWLDRLCECTEEFN